MAMGSLRYKVSWTLDQVILKNQASNQKRDIFTTTYGHQM